MIGALMVMSVGVAVALGWVGWRFWRITKDPMGMAGGTQLMYQVDVEHAFGAERGRDPATIVRDTANAVRGRLAHETVFGSARAYGTVLVVLVPAVGKHDDMDAFERRLSRTGRLEFKLIDDGSPVMDQLAERARRAPLPGVRVEEETWTAKQSGAQHTDHYLAAADRATLEQALQALTAEAPLPADHEILFERRASDWRTYYAFRTAHLDNQDVKDADVTWDESGRPNVSVQFNDGAKLAALSEQAIGHKLAIVLEGVVLMAPVVDGKIPGGRAIITLGSDLDPYALHAEAKDIARTLVRGGLPAPIILESKVTVPALR
jgi:preprotein translocase subunit SecD